MRCNYPSCERDSSCFVCIELTVVKDKKVGLYYIEGPAYCWAHGNSDKFPRKIDMLEMMLVKRILELLGYSVDWDRTRMRTFVIGVNPQRVDVIITLAASRWGAKAGFN